MANYAVTTYITGPKPVTEAVADLENKIETVDNTKVIRLFQIVPVARDRDLVIGVLIYDS